MSKEIAFGVGVTDITPGVRAKVEIQDPFRNVLVSRTARHEALHAVAAVLTGSNVVDATIRPGKGFLGRVRLNEFNSIAFMAPHAFGCDGTGHDVAVVAWMGHDTGAAGVAARSLLVGQEKKVQAVAAILEQNGTISGFEVGKAMDEVDNPQAEVVISDSNGNTREFVSRIRVSDKFMIPVGLTDLL